MTAMSDDAVRAELERLDEYYVSDWNEHEKCKAEMPHDCPTRSALRLLAESQQALGAVVRLMKEAQEQRGDSHAVQHKVEEAGAIARDAVKGER